MPLLQQADCVLTRSSELKLDIDQYMNSLLNSVMFNSSNFSDFTIKKVVVASMNKSTKRLNNEATINNKDNSVNNDIDSNDIIVEKLIDSVQASILFLNWVTRQGDTITSDSTALVTLTDLERRLLAYFDIEVSLHQSSCSTNNDSHFCKLFSFQSYIVYMTHIAIVSDAMIYCQYAISTHLSLFLS